MARHALHSCAAQPGRSRPGDDEVTPEVQHLYAQANAAGQSGDECEPPSKSIKAIIKFAPHLSAAYNNLGMLYFDRRDYAHAAKVLQHGLELNPNMTSAAMLGMSYVQLGENEKAEPLLRKALRANPKDDQLEMMLIRMLINEKKLARPHALE